MLEQYFKLPAILRRHRSGLVGPYLESFVSLTGGLGYPRVTVRRQCCVLRDFGLWLESEELGVADVDEDQVRRHIDNRRRKGKLGRGDEASTVHRFVEHLREVTVQGWG